MKKISVDIFVGIHPERINEINELEEALSKIGTYELVFNCNAGVLYMQNRQFGSSLIITSSREAHYELNKPILNEPRTPEWGLKFYTKAYFEELKKKLHRDNNADPSKFILYRRRHTYQTSSK